MTEAAYQQARKVMVTANLLRGYITTAKANVRKWTNIESALKENMQPAKAAGAKKQLDKAIVRLRDMRKKFVDLKFPDADMKDLVENTECKLCTAPVKKGIDYCTECNP
jgi:hypothetical protein